MKKNIDILFSYVQGFFITPTSNKLDIRLLDDNFKVLGKAMAYLGDSFSEIYRFSDNISKGRLEYQPMVKNDLVEPLREIHRKLGGLKEEMERIADGSYEGKFEFMGQLSEAFADMLHHINGLNVKKRECLEEDEEGVTDLEKNKEKMIEEGIFQQIAHYDRLMEISGEMRRFRHDIRNHLLCLDSLLADGQVEKARDYILSITPIVYTTDLVLNTGNYIFDALLSEKIKQAKLFDIKVDVRISVSRKLEISNVDWCILVGNAMDNAIEACQKLPPDDRWISIVVTHKGNSLSTRIENSCGDVLKKEGDFFKTTKKDKTSHGMGLKNIALTVDKYNGMFDASCEDDVFSLFFMLIDI